MGMLIDGKWADRRPAEVAGRFVRPGKDRIPRIGLSGDEPFGGFGTVAHEIGGEILFRVRRDRCGGVRHAVDDGVGKPRERHARWVDVFTLRLPFFSENIRQRRGRRGQRPLRWRPHRAAIKRKAKATLSLRHRDLFVEPTPQARPHAAARGLVRIERLLLADILKDFTHMGCRLLRHRDFT